MQRLGAITNSDYTSTLGVFTLSTSSNSNITITVSDNKTVVRLTMSTQGANVTSSGGSKSDNLLISAYASGADRTINFDSTFSVSSNITPIVVPNGRQYIFEFMHNGTKWIMKDYYIVT